MSVVRPLHAAPSAPRVTDAVVLPVARLLRNGVFEEEYEVAIGVAQATAGCRLQLLNRSVDPRAEFERDAVTFEVRLSAPGEGRVLLDAHQMRALELEPGDLLGLRVLDSAGAVSFSADFVLMRQGDRARRVRAQT